MISPPASIGAGRPRRSCSPLTRQFVRSLTNQVKVTLFFDKQDWLYGTVSDLLNLYHLANPRITVRAVDVMDAGAAQKVRTEYKLGNGVKNIIIFDCPGMGQQDFDSKELTRGTPEYVTQGTNLFFLRQPTDFVGESFFTAALIKVTSPKRLKAYFVEDHLGEHEIARGDDFGYKTFQSILLDNYIEVHSLQLQGTNTVPADCDLLVVAGAQNQFSALELGKIDQYLSQGGRLLALFNSLLIEQSGTMRGNGLEKLLEKWGVEVGNTVVVDPLWSSKGEGLDMSVWNFAELNPVVNPLVGFSLYMIQPRKVGKLRTRAQSADAPRVDEIASSTDNAFMLSEPGRRQKCPLMVAVENTIRGMTTERGSTRMLVVGDSLMLDNLNIGQSANRDFAGYAVNWLLDRKQLLGAMGPRPIGSYRLVMTAAQVAATRWLLLAGHARGRSVPGGPGLAAPPALTRVFHELPGRERRQTGSAGFQACCIADFQVGSPSPGSGARRVWKPAIQQTWKSALQTACEIRALRGLAGHCTDPPKPRRPIADEPQEHLVLAGCRGGALSGDPGARTVCPASQPRP